MDVLWNRPELLDSSVGQLDEGCLLIGEIATSIGALIQDNADEVTFRINERVGSIGSTVTVSTDGVVTKDAIRVLNDSPTEPVADARCEASLEVTGLHRGHQ